MPFTTLPARDLIRRFNEKFSPTLAPSSAATLADGWGKQYAQPGVESLMPDAPPFDSGGALSSFFSYGGGQSTTINTTNTVDITNIINEGGGNGGAGAQGPPGPQGPPGDPGVLNVSFIIDETDSTAIFLGGVPSIDGSGNVSWPRKELVVSVATIVGENLLLALKVNDLPDGVVSGELC